MDEDDKLWDDVIERVAFLQRIGLNPVGSVAERLAGARQLIRKLQAYEGEVERDARSGDFVLAVPGEAVRAVINPDGRVLIVHGDHDHG